MAGLGDHTLHGFRLLPLCCRRMAGKSGHMTRGNQSRPTNRTRLINAKRFRALAAAPVGIFGTDPQGTLAFANRRAFEIAGIAPREALEDALLAPLHDDDRDRVVAAWRSALAQSVPFRSEHRLVRDDGAAVWVLVQAVPEVDEQGSIAGWIGTLSDITERKRTELELEDTSRRLRRLTAHIESVREEESARMAREVHDQLGSTLTMVKLGLATALEKIEAGQPLHERLTSLLGLTEGALQTVKKISSALRPAMLDTLGLVATVKWHAEEFTRLTGIRAELRLPEYIRLSSQRATAVFRIIQEALTNVARHSQAKTVAIHARKSRGELVVRIADDGVGMGGDSQSGTGTFGLLGMRERALYLGGEVIIEAAAAGGTTVTLHLPLEDPGHSKQRREAAHGADTDRR